MHPRSLNSLPHITLADLLLFQQGPTRLFKLFNDPSAPHGEPLARTRPAAPAQTEISRHVTRRPREIVRAAGEQCGRRCDGVEALAKQLIWPFSATRRPMNRWWASRPVGVQESDPVPGGPLFPSLDHDDVPRYVVPGRRYAPELSGVAVCRGELRAVRGHGIPAASVPSTPTSTIVAARPARRGSQRCPRPTDRRPSMTVSLGRD